MNTFDAGGTTYRKSSWSQTDWTKQCVGVATSDCTCHMQLADSVTEQELTGVPRGEFLAFLAAV